MPAVAVPMPATRATANTTATTVKRFISRPPL
jgi:hypothetical protein